MARAMSSPPRAHNHSPTTTVLAIMDQTMAGQPDGVSGFRRTDALQTQLDLGGSRSTDAMMQAQMIPVLVVYDSMNVDTSSGEWMEVPSESRLTRLPILNVNLCVEA